MAFSSIAMVSAISMARVSGFVALGRTIRDTGWVCHILTGRWRTVIAALPPRGELAGSDIRLHGNSRPEAPLAIGASSSGVPARTTVRSEEFRAAARPGSKATMAFRASVAEELSAAADSPAAAVAEGVRR